MKTELTKAELAFIESRGLMAEEDGQPRILGRMWGLLMLLEEPITAAKIAEFLQISRGSVSTNLKMLLMMRVVRKSTQPGEREAFYAIAEDPYSAMIKAYIDRMTANREEVEASLAGIDNPIARKRISDLRDFYRFSEEANMALLATLK